MDLKDWLSLAMTVINFAFVVWVYLQSRRAATRAEVESRNAHVDREIGKLRTEVALVKQGICNVPDDGDLSKIHGRIDEVHGELKHVCGIVNAMNRTLDNINVYLIQRGK